MAAKKTPKRRAGSTAKPAAGKTVKSSRKVRAAGAAQESPTFVFRGTVVQSGAATFAEVPAGEDTVVVHVDEIIDAPDLLRDYEGQDVTVKLGRGQRADEGKSYLFRTAGWIFGAGLGVRCLSLSAAGDAQLQRAAEEVQATRTNALRARAQRAELVVTGQVAQVRKVPRPAGQPITEHDPDWQEATVTVHDVARGGRRQTAGRRVVVRFAGSRDVKWALSPKFVVGDRGLFMLGEKTAEHLAMRSAAAVPKDQYLVVDPADFVPEEQAQAVLSKIK
jgi:hypothetical protein